MSIVQWLREEPGKYFARPVSGGLVPSEAQVHHRRRLAGSAKLRGLEQLEKRPDVELMGSPKPEAEG